MDAWDAWFGTGSDVPDQSWTFSMPQAGDLIRYDPSYTASGLLQMYPGLSALTEGPRLPDIPNVDLTANLRNNPALASLYNQPGAQGAPPTEPASPVAGAGNYFKQMGSRMLQMAQQNPAAALMLLGGAGAGLAGALGGSDKVKLPGDVKNLLTQVNAGGPKDPNAAARYAQMREDLARQMTRDIGPGWETSTPGIEALRKLNESINADQYQRELGQQQVALSGLGTVGNLYNVAQATQDKKQQNLYGLAGLLGTMGLGTLGKSSFARA